MSAPNVKPVKGRSEQKSHTGKGDGSGPDAARAHGAVRAAVAGEAGLARASSGGLITEARWLARRGRVGEPVRLEAALHESVADGAAVQFEVFDHEKTSVSKLEGKAKTGSAQVEWTFEAEAKTGKDGSTAPGADGEAAPAEGKGENPGDEEKESPPPTFTFVATVESEHAEAPTLVFGRHVEDLRLRFEIDPEEGKEDAHTFRLSSSDPTFAAKTRTMKDDLISGDGFVDLLFPDLDIALSYSLEVDPGEGESYKLFDEVPYLKLVEKLGVEDKPGDEDAKPDASPEGEQGTADAGAQDAQDDEDDEDEFDDDDLDLDPFDDDGSYEWETLS